jgi:hypothetical protein
LQTIVLVAFLLGTLYAPIYFYCVKIRKRPLRNKIMSANDERASIKIIREEE